jgi:hypothetical protein
MTSMSSKLEAATGVNIAGRRNLGVGSPGDIEDSAGDFEVDLFLSTGTARSFARLIISTYHLF